MPEAKHVKLLELGIMPQSQREDLVVEVSDVDAMSGRSVAQRGRFITGSECMDIGRWGGEELLESLVQLGRNFSEQGGISMVAQVLANHRKVHGDHVFPLAVDARRCRKKQSYDEKRHGRQRAYDLPFVHDARLEASIGLVRREATIQIPSTRRSSWCERQALKDNMWWSGAGSFTVTGKKFLIDRV